MREIFWNISQEIKSSTLTVSFGIFEDSEFVGS